ncbi:MAG: GNAT family N-acetyltransferase [Lachnospiraceae bacterium]|nr:GNAT family N-acetyltransferase [Lachnospiraceae bacterium]
MVKEITNLDEKKRVTRLILESLPEWFGIAEAREEYISESAECRCFAAYDGKQPIGMLCLMETGKDTMELHVLGVKKEYHRKGLGKELFAKAKEATTNAGYSFMQVKTVQMGKYEVYDRTNCFYKALGFKEFEVFPTLWDERNPCQVYVMALR